MFKGFMTIVLSLFFWTSVSAVPPAPWEIEDIMGKEAVLFNLKDLNGVEISLSSFKGKVILVNFWATWCGPCKNEMPSLNKLYNTYRDKGLTVIGISIDRSAEAVRNFMKKIPLDLPVLLDGNLIISKKYKVFAYPTTFLIDRDGILREKFIGEEDWSDTELNTLIKRYLNGSR